MTPLLGFKPSSKNSHSAGLCQDVSLVQRIQIVPPLGFKTQFPKLLLSLPVKCTGSRKHNATQLPGFGGIIMNPTNQGGVEDHVIESSEVLF